MGDMLQLVRPVTVGDGPPQSLPLPPHPGLLQTVWALKVGWIEQLGVVGVDGLLALRGVFPVGGGVGANCPRCGHRALRGKIPL